MSKIVDQGLQLTIQTRQRDRETEASASGGPVEFQLVSSWQAMIGLKGPSENNVLCGTSQLNRST
jgi:hypothetical protein